MTSFVGGPIFIGTNPKTGKTMVNTALVNFAKGGPVEVKVGKNDAAVLRVKWVVEDIEDAGGNQIPAMRYSMVLQKADLTFSLYAKAIRYDNSMGSQGTCQLLKQP